MHPFTAREHFGDRYVVGPADLEPRPAEQPDRFRPMTHWPTRPPTRSGQHWPTRPPQAGVPPTATA